MNETAKHKNPWTELELEYVADHYGLIPTKQIAHQLNRSERAVYTAATQKLNQRITDNFYSATELARLLGLPKIGRIVRWVEKGWLKGKKSPICSGQFKFWCFDEEDIVECLRQRPWLVDFRQMLQHYFRSIVKDEWERDRWYTVKQAEPLIGCPHAVYRYIQMGWLRADEGPAPGKNKWIIRDSAIKAFLKSKPHLQHRRSASSSSMRKYKMSVGLPSRLTITWLFQCPDCGDTIKVVAPPMLHGPQVRDLFLEQHTNGQCSHGTECLIYLSQGDYQVVPSLTKSPF